MVKVGTLLRVRPAALSKGNSWSGALCIVTRVDGSSFDIKRLCDGRTLGGLCWPHSAFEETNDEDR